MRDNLREKIRQVLNIEGSKDTDIIVGVCDFIKSNVDEITGKYNRPSLIYQAGRMISFCSGASERKSVSPAFDTLATAFLREFDQYVDQTKKATAAAQIMATMAAQLAELGIGADEAAAMIKAAYSTPLTPDTPTPPEATVPETMVSEEKVETVPKKKMTPKMAKLFLEQLEKHGEDAMKERGTFQYIAEAKEVLGRKE